MSALTSSDWTKARRRAKAKGWDPSWIADAQDVRAVLEGGCRFDADAGQHVVDFFTRFLRHSKGRRWAGQPFTLLEWQDRLLRRLFGWKRADGTRRFRRGGIWIPKKNGKSTLAAGIELYLLAADGEPGAEVYTGAVDRGQAGIIYGEAANMVRQSPDLRKRLQLVDSRKTIAFPGMAAKLQALSADAEQSEGLNAHGVVLDELHAWKRSNLWDVMQYAGAARDQPLYLVVSTAGVYDETSIGWEQYSYAKGVADDRIHDWAFLAVVYEPGPHDDWKDPATWRKTNPSLGVTIDEAIFAEECLAAQQSPAAAAKFQRYRLNIWNRPISRSIDLEVWDAQAGHDEPFRPEDFAGGVVFGGLDLSSRSDISAVVYGRTCPDDVTNVDVAARCWVPAERLLDKTNPNAALYRQWVEEGWLEVTPGSAIDYDLIEAAILADAERFDLRELNIDHLFQGQQVANHLTAEGLTVFPMRQTFTGQGPAMAEFRRLELLGGLHHGGHPILRWAADNCESVFDGAQNEKLVKPATNSAKKIDPMVALVMMLDRVSRCEVDPPSVYATRGLVEV